MTYFAPNGHFLRRCARLERICPVTCRYFADQLKLTIDCSLNHEGRGASERFLEEQLAGILREHHCSPVAPVAKKHGFSEQADRHVRQRVSGMSANDMSRLPLQKYEARS